MKPEQLPECWRDRAKGIRPDRPNDRDSAEYWRGVKNAYYELADELEGVMMEEVIEESEEGGEQVYRND